MTIRTIKKLLPDKAKDIENGEKETRVEKSKTEHGSGLEYVKQKLQKNFDMVFNEYKNDEYRLVFVYCESVVDAKYIDEVIYPKLNVLSLQSGAVQEQLGSLLKLQDLTNESKEKLPYYIYNGSVLIFTPGENVFAIELKQIPQRTPEEPATETSIRGPRDGFVEDLSTNIALIRKRLKTPTLLAERFIVGKRSNTELALVYLEDVINPSIVAEVKERIGKLDLDIVSSVQQLEEMLSDQPLSLFPTTDYTGRPDFAVECLNQGRFLLVVDGHPTVSTAPVTLSLVFKSPEDSTLNFYFVSFERLVRLTSLFVSTLLPGLWVALTSNNIEQIPFLLVATISVSRKGLPLSTPFEMFIMLALFELFNEAAVRLPKAIGQTVAVIGGLIVGDAAIRAGLTSPTMLVIGAVTFVSGFTLVNQLLSSSITILRFTILLLATFFGIFGVVIGFLMVVLYLSGTTSFGIPYLANLASVDKTLIMKSYLRLPWVFRKERDANNQPIDSDTQED